MKFEINCDLGEGEPPQRTRALMKWIQSANVACGGHGGTTRTMHQCVRWCGEMKVHLGAHPGPWSRVDAGRNAIRISPDEFDLLLLHQVGGMETIARMEKVPLHHIKLHGALYHASETQPEIARHYVRLVRDRWPGVAIYARSGGQVVELARRYRVPVLQEAFAERGYFSDGRLVPRGESGALLIHARNVKLRIQTFLHHGHFISRCGKTVRLKVDTFCIHADTPNSLSMVKTVHRTIFGSSMNR